MGGPEGKKLPKKEMEKNPLAGADLSGAKIKRVKSAKNYNGEVLDVSDHRSRTKRGVGGRGKYPHDGGSASVRGDG